MRQGAQPKLAQHLRLEPQGHRDRSGDERLGDIKVRERHCQPQSDRLHTSFLACPGRIKDVQLILFRSRRKVLPLMRMKQVSDALEWDTGFDSLDVNADTVVRKRNHNLFTRM